MALTPTAVSRAASIASRAGDSLLRTSPNYPFVWVHFPNAANSSTVKEEGLDGPTLLPSVRPWTLRAGTSGIKTLNDRDAKEDPSKAWRNAQAELEAKGAVIIPWDTPIPKDCIPEGMDAEGGYLRQIQCKGGTFYHSLWDEPRQPLEGAPMVPKTHHAELNRWLVSLVETGVLPPVSDQVRDDLIARRARRVRSALADTRDDIAEVRDLRVGRQKTGLRTAESARRPQRAGNAAPMHSAQPLPAVHAPVEAVPEPVKAEKAPDIIARIETMDSIADLTDMLEHQFKTVQRAAHARLDALTGAN